MRFSQCVTLHDIAIAYQRAGSTEDRIWKMLAYVGRYGHQPIDSARKLTVRELNRLSAKVAEIVEKENEAGKMPGVSD